MSRLLATIIASGFAFGLTAAIGQTLDTGPQKTSSAYKMTTKTCQSPGQAGKAQCLTDVKATEENSRIQCEKLTDQARRECVLEAFVQQHDRMIAEHQIEKSAGAPPGGPQPR